MMDKLVLLLLLSTIAFINTNNVNAQFYTNPLNEKSVDVFFLIDESYSFLNYVKHQQLKTFLNKITTNLHPIDALPSSGIIFYRIASDLNIISGFPTTSAARVKNQLDAKQYLAPQPNLSSLYTAVFHVESTCRVTCRAGMARTLIIIAANFNLSIVNLLRRLENDLSMNMIIVSVGSQTSSFSHFQQWNPFTFATFEQLMIAFDHLSSVISDVSRLLEISSVLNVTGMIPEEYYTFQMNINRMTISSDVLIIFTLNCDGCHVSASLIEKRLTTENTKETVVSHSNKDNHEDGDNVPYNVYYLQLPKSTDRFYLSFQSKMITNSSGIVHLASMPIVMENPVATITSLDLVSTNG